MTLNDKQKRFCEEYIIDLNGAQAAIRAGYSEKTAKEIASRLLTKVNVQEFIQNRQKELQQSTGITQERVLREYAKVAFFDIRNIYTETNTLKSISDLDDDSASVIAGIDVMEEKGGNGQGEQVTLGWTKKIKLHNKIAALDSLGKHLGIFEKDNEQVKNSVILNFLKPDDYKQGHQHD